MRVTGVLWGEVTTPKGVQDYGGGHGDPLEEWSGRPPRLGGQGIQETFQKTWSCRGALRARAISRNLEGAGVLWDTWPHTGAPMDGGFMQKSGPQIPLEAKTETSTAESLVRMKGEGLPSRGS